MKKKINKSEEAVGVQPLAFSDRTRFPIVLEIDGIDFDPDVSEDIITRSSYDFIFTEDELMKLYMYLVNRVKHRIFKNTRIRFTGRSKES